MSTLPAVKDQEPVYMTYYNITSSINYSYDSRYCVKIGCEIKILPNDPMDETLIGMVDFYKILLDTAIEDGYSPFNVFDTYESTMQVGQHIFDFKNWDWDRKIYKYYKTEFLPTNLIVLARIMILPEYRGQKIAQRVLKDIYNIFHDGCLFVLKCFPLQHEAGLESNPWYPKMQFDQFPKGTKGFGKLYGYYREIGFESILGIPRDIMFLNPDEPTKKFENIKLDD